MIYDTLPMGGASQFHPHAHGFLASQYLGHMAVQHTAARRYEDENGSEYWNDLIEAHHALGLSVTLGDAIAIAPLVCYLKTSIPVTKCVTQLLFRINFNCSPTICSVK
jgi:galactose-1-phosphate uridylyltransferase